MHVCMCDEVLSMALWHSARGGKGIWYLLIVHTLSARGVWSSYGLFIGEGGGGRDISGIMGDLEISDLLFPCCLWVFICFRFSLYL